MDKMNQEVSQLDCYLQEQVASCARRKEKLLAEERPDEAVFEQVRGNIYDIFRSVLSVAAEKYRDDAQAGREFFRLKLEQIPSGWQASYEKAREHDDTVKMQLESIKLAAARDIRENFMRIWEGEL